MGNGKSASGTGHRTLVPALVLLALCRSLPAGAQENVPQVAVAGSPSLAIGEAAGDESHLIFHEIRGAISLVDGSIVVADGGASELRVFDSAGRFTKRFGREGDGPQEFRSIDWINRCGGPTVFVYDALRSRMTEWSTDGQLLDDFTVQSPREGLPPYAVECGPDEGFIVLGWPDIVNIAASGAYRPSVELGTATANGQFVKVIAKVEGGDRFRTANNDGPIPLGRTTTVGASGTSIIVGTADSFYVDVLSLDGSRHAVGLSRPRAALTRQVRNDWIEERIRDLPPDRQVVHRRRLRNADFLPDSLPAYTGFHVDQKGLVWLQPHPVPGQPDAPWEVLTITGEPIAQVSLPSSFRPTDIGVNHLMGVAVDDLGVERVLVFELTR